MISIHNAYKVVKKWASTIAFRDKKIVLIEASDFGTFYGFVFKAKNIYNNAYWCIDKKTLKLFLFLPVQNVKIFNNRHVYTKGELKEYGSTNTSE